MSPSKVKGKLVLCKLENWGVDSVVKANGGIGAIVASPRFLDVAMIFMAPGTIVNYTVGEKIYDYIRKSRYIVLLLFSCNYCVKSKHIIDFVLCYCSSPTATIYRSQEVNVTAPFIGSFSSRGPNPGSVRLLKVRVNDNPSSESGV